MKYFLSILVFCSCASAGIANSTLDDVTVAQVDTMLPRVFLLGEFEIQMDKISSEHSTQLLESCNNDIDEAYTKWMSFIREMEAYGDQIKFDLKGVKVWLNVFFEKNGKINHIGYYLKPNSKNVKNEEFSAFLKSFMNHYTFPHNASKNYSHYGSAAFPVFTGSVISPAQDTQVTRKNE